MTRKVFDQEEFKEVFGFTDEQVERVFRAAEGDFEKIDPDENPIHADEPIVELDTENDDLSDIPSEEEIKEELKEIEEESEDE